MMLANDYWKTCYEELASQSKLKVDIACNETAKARQQRNNALRKIDELTVQIQQLTAKPKFHLGQIVVSNYNGYESAFTIHGQRFTQSLNEQGWYYTQQRQDSSDRRWVPEKQLREQTDVERGLTVNEKN